MNALTSDDVQNMINELLTEYSYSTVKKAYDNLNNCMKLGVIRGHILKNPVNGVMLPTKTAAKEQKIVRAYTPEEVSSIVKEATSCYKNGNLRHRYGYVIILILNTGMRLGEALYLKWKDVNFEKRRIYIHGTTVECKNRNDGEQKYIVRDQESPKTVHSNRYIPLNNEAITALENLKTICNDNIRVIATEEHTIVRQNRIYLTMSSILERCGIQGVNDKVHALRHTYATTLITNPKIDMDIKIISEILGHSDVSTTFNIYYHVLQEQKMETVDMLNDMYNISQHTEQNGEQG